MTMTSLISLISPNSIALIGALFFLISPSYCLGYKHSPNTSTGWVVEEKARVGSTPPRCHNKCNLCHPCMAVQMPTVPSHHRVDPSSVQQNTNYKPLGWKCTCAGHLYNP